ncbi:MAG: glycoside hydrolase family 140 protein [Lachnospirales bacterium]
MKFWDYGNLQVSENNRYLKNGDKPFFWLGDTAWLMFTKLDLDETYNYLRNRKEKGYNVIQVTIIHALPALDKEKSSLPEVWKENNSPLYNNDFSNPNLDGGFWTHIDEVLKIAENLNMYLALLPAWGSMVKENFLNQDNAKFYSEFLGNRYKNNKNIIWLVGGDVRGDVNLNVFNTIGSTLKKICPNHLVGYHPFGRTSSSAWFNKEPWLDFNMFQSGHRRYDQFSLGQWDDNKETESFFGEDSWKYVQQDYAKSIKKPTLDGEPSYEEIPQGLHDSEEPYWHDNDVRRYAYWSVFQGACGHTYGHNSIMQFYKTTDKKPAYGAKEFWEIAINDIGSGQMSHLKNLLTSVDFINGTYNDTFLVNKQQEKYERISVFSGNDFIFAYTYLGNPFKLDLSMSEFNHGDVYWFDPISGIYNYISQIELKEIFKFIPPNKKSGHNDWVLVIKQQN